MWTTQDWRYICGLALQTTITVLQGACVLATLPLGVYLTFQVCRYTTVWVCGTAHHLSALTSDVAQPRPSAVFCSGIARD